MGSFSKATRGAGAAILTGGTLLTASPAWSAAVPPSVRVVPIVRVPCSAAALAGAITRANAQGGVLRLAPFCVYDITTPATAATGLPTITGDVALAGGPSTTIRRNPASAAFRVFDVASGGRLRVAGIAILNGRTAALGGGIQNAGTLVLSRVTLSGNTAASGGGVANNPGGTVTMWRTLVSGNATTSVGGGAVLNFGRLTVGTSVLKANTAPINGGGINTQPTGVARLVQSTVELNTSGGLGGGLSNLGNTTLSRTLVTRNRASAGGGIATGNANVLLSRSVVTNNQPGNCSPPNTIAGCAG